jgi:hypothetical protein
MKQRFFGAGIKAADDALFAMTGTHRGYKTSAGQLDKPLFGFLDRSAITGVECVPGVARAVRHNLDWHGKNSPLWQRFDLGLNFRNLQGRSAPPWPSSPSPKLAPHVYAWPEIATFVQCQKRKPRLGRAGLSHG